MRQKILLHCKSEVIKPTSDQFKASASTVHDKYGFDLKPQMDLLYVRSTLVSSGMNENDDTFIPEDLWAARHTPVLKPTNWQHKDKDIIGVIYSVQARDLKGNILDFSQAEAPSVPFELVTESVVFSLIHTDKAEEIEKRAKANNLFVSMECWFDDYNYCLANKAGEVNKVIARNQETSFLDSHLKAKGGTGSYEQNRVGRALKNITFGGHGYVDIPANKRSTIDSVLNWGENQLGVSVGEKETVSEPLQDDMDSLLKSLFSDIQEREDMNKVTASDGNTQPTPEGAVDHVADAVVSKLEANRAARQARKNEQKAQESLRATAEKAKADADKAVAQVAALETAGKASKAENEKLVAALVKADASLAAFMKEVAGATSDTPPEIKAIDAGIAADTGDAVFQAKLAWIQKSYATLVAKAKRVDELEAQFAEASTAMRDQEIRNLFTESGLAKEEIDMLVKAGLAKNDTDFEEWYMEKQVLVKHLKEVAAKKKGKKNEMKNASPKADDGDDAEPDADEDDAKASIKEGFAALINGVPEGEESDLNSGVNAAGLRRPKNKIAGAASNAILEGVTPEDKADLADADGGGEEAEGENPFKTLAAELYNVDVKKDRPSKAKASFDPVDEN